MLRGLFSARISIERFFQAISTDDLITVRNYINENKDNAAAINRPHPSHSEPHFALIAAAHEGRLEVVKALLAAPGIDPNVLNKNGDSALIAAARIGHHDIVKALLAAPHLKIAIRNNNYGVTASEVAYINGYTDITYLIIAERKARAFRRAAHRGELNKVQEYIAASRNNPALINASDAHGLTALSRAASQAHVAIVQALLAVPGIDVNIPDARGFTALSRAAFNGHTDCVTLLLTAPEIKGNVVDVNGNTALIHAATRGHTDTVQVLLNNININLAIQNHYQLTAARAAEQNHHSDIVQLIEAAAAAPAVVRNLLDTPIRNIAVENSLPEAITAEQFLHAAASGDLATVQAYIVANPKNAVAMNVTDEDGCTALYLAANFGHATIVNALGSVSTVKVNQPNKLGYTPLIGAVLREMPNAITALLAIPHIEVNDRDLLGNTALHYAAIKGREDILILLLCDSRVDLMIKNELSRTANQCARFAGSPHLAILIEETIRRAAASSNDQSVAAVNIAAIRTPAGGVRLFDLSQQDRLAEQGIPPPKPT